MVRKELTLKTEYVDEIQKQIISKTDKHNDLVLVINDEFNTDALED